MKCRIRSKKMRGRRRMPGYVCIICIFIYITSGGEHREMTNSLGKDEGEEEDVWVCLYIFICIYICIYITSDCGHCEMPYPLENDEGEEEDAWVCLYIYVHMYTCVCVCVNMCV